jgi:acyl-CoA hydrolase
VVADHIDGKQISGVGGHEDFVAGAEMRVDDHSLLCMRSTAVANGVTRSRIVPFLPEGSVISTPRHHTGVVITEYGAADLSGRTERERAAALVEIAHPDFRDELADTAATIGRS